jgi:tetratricopeptide (TPR) repeat protein
MATELTRRAASRQAGTAWEADAVETAVSAAGPHRGAPIVAAAVPEEVREAEPSPRIDLPFELANDDGEITVAMDNTEQHAVTRSNDEVPVEPMNLERAEPREPSAEDLLYNAAREAEAQGEGRRAVSIYRELLEMKPGHVPARNNLALLLDQSGDHEAALRELQLCLTHEPNNPRVLVNRGAVLGAMVRYADAEADLRRALEVDTSNAEAHFNLGLLMSRKGLWAEALPYLRRSIELEGTQPVAYYYLGEALNHVDDLKGAMQAYQRAIDLGPTNAKAYYGLGIIYDRLNRPEEAAHMYRRSREIAQR